MHRFIFAAIAAASILTTTVDASANGRFPQSNHIFFSPKDPDLVIVRVTFGMLISKDRGKTWDWVCEKAIGTSGVEDPMYAIGPTGRIIGTTFSGITRGSDDACSFVLAPPPLNVPFIDLSQRPDPKQTVVFSSTYDKQDDAGEDLFLTRLFETTDEGETFTQLGDPIDPTVLGETVDVAPANPDRLYVSGTKDAASAPKGALLYSNDHGKTFTLTVIPFEAGERAIFIAGVDPKNADRVYLRTLAAVDRPARLMVSDDGGKTVRTVFTGKGTLPGFTLSPDGAKVWIGGGLDGVQVASTADFAFTQKSTIPVECLAYASDGLWACSSEKGGFVAGISPDEGATFTAKLHFCDVRGPLSCPTSTSTGKECPSQWPAQRATLGCDDVVPDGGSEPNEVPPTTGGGGCSGCFIGPQHAAPTAAALAGIALAIAFARRRRR